MVNGTQNWPNCVSSRDSRFWSIWSYGFIWYIPVHGLCDQYLVGHRKFAFLAGTRLPRWLLIAAAQMISLWNCDAVTFSCGPTLTSQVQSWIALVALSIRSPCFLTSANAAFVLRPHVALVGFALWVLTKFGGPGPHQSHPKRTIRSNSFLAFSCGESEASHLSWSTIILWSYYCLYMLIYTHSWGMLRHDLVRHPSSPSTRDDPGWPGPGLAWNPDCRRGIAAPPCASPRVGTSNIHCPVQDCLENGWKWTLKASRPGFFLWTVYKSRYQSMNFSTQI